MLKKRPRYYLGVPKSLFEFLKMLTSSDKGCRISISDELSAYSLYGISVGLNMYTEKTFKIS